MFLAGLASGFHSSVENQILIAPAIRACDTWPVLFSLAKKNCVQYMCNAIQWNKCVAVTAVN